MWATLKAFVLVTVVSELIAENDDLLIQTPLGSITGFYRTASYGRTYRAFEGIPYGKPPINDLRFEPPQPYGPWNGTLLATSPGSICMQYPHVTPNPDDRVTGSEDCLFLNIYTPASNKSASELLPVLFWIHGGAFQFGNGHEQGSTYIMNRNVVFVNVNYRLGVLGFISTEDAVVPGNMGLKDQSLALRWVHENIASFGGDPKRITVGGISAGGASAHYHVLSPMSRGLLKGAMSFSGTALDCWTQAKNSAQKAKEVAALMGCPTTDNINMMKCLKLQPGRKMMQLIGKFQPWLFNPFTPFGPVVETNSSRPFIERSPIDIITSGDVADIPWMTSVTSEEGLYPAAEFIEKPNLMAQLNDNWETIAPHLLDFNFTIPQAKHAQVAKAIRTHYLGNRKIETKNAFPLIHMIGDRLYSADGQKAAKLMAKVNRSPVWFYYYSYRSPTYSLTKRFGVVGNYGASHSDDTSLIAGNLGSNAIDKSTLDVQNILLNIVETFMKTGIPRTAVHWPRVKPLTQSLEYLHILGPKRLRAVSKQNFAERKFWSSIDFSENKIGN